MKKTFLTLFLMTTMFGAAYADGREKPTSVDKLRQAFSLRARPHYFSEWLRKYTSQAS